MGSGQSLNLNYGLQRLGRLETWRLVGGGGQVQDAKTSYGAPSAPLEVRNREFAEDAHPSFWGRRGGVGRALPLGARRAVPLPPHPSPQAAGEGDGKGDGASRWQFGDCGLCGWQPGEAAASRERGAGVGS